jgi:hypothetical protein
MRNIGARALGLYLNAFVVPIVTVFFYITYIRN